MKAIIEFIQSFGIAEFIIMICLGAICVIALFDSKSIGKKYDADNERFKKYRKKHNGN